MSQLSYNELRALYFLWKLREPLRCEGEVWSFYREPTVAISRDTLERMIGRGWLERCYKYDNAAHDDYRLSVDGIHAAEGYEADYLRQIERTI
jgi:hypothetical protein